VFTARYALSPHIKQIRFVFKGLMLFVDKDTACCRNNMKHVNKISNANCRVLDAPATAPQLVTD
jgi:hypothetical protein